MTSLIVATFLGAALYAVLTAAGLQFIGLGDPNSQSWGTMLYWAQNNEALFAGMPLWAIAPGRLHRAPRRRLRAPQLRLRRDQQPGAARPQARARAAPEDRAVAEPAAGLGRRTSRSSRSRTSPSPTRPTPVRSSPSTTSTSSSPAASSSRSSASRAAGSRRCSTRSRGCSARRCRARSSAAACSSRAATSSCSRRRSSARVRWRDLSVVMQSAMNALNPVLTVAEQMRDACRGPLEHVEGGDRGALARGAAARLDRPGAPAQLSAPALGRDAAAGDDRDGAPLHARPRDHGRADLGARRRRPALAHGADQGAAGASSASRSSSSRTTCRS